MPETIGQRLKNIRLSRQLSLEKVAEVTRVRAHYLRALENDDLSAMASTAQARGFLRLYADFLGLDLDAVMQEMRQADSPPVPVEAAPSLDAVAPSPSIPEPVPQFPSSTADKPQSQGFWSRLLRRPSPQKPVEAAEPLPEPVAPLESPPVVIPATLEAAPEPQPKPASSRAKKTVAKKPKVEKVDGPKGRPKASSKAEAKKKAQLKGRTKR